MSRALFLILFCFSLVFLPVFAAAPEVVGEAAILIVADTGEVLYQKNSQTKMFPASTTKILTAIIIIEDLKLTDTVIGDREAAFTGGSRIYVMEEESFTVEELLYALLLESANDAAVALAKKHSGSVEVFAQVMNARAKLMGATSSNFVTPNGLHDDNHYATASDMAKIAAHAMKNESFRNFVKTYQHDIAPTNKQPDTRHLYNSNRFLYGVGAGNKIEYKGKVIDIKYDIIDGVKTGYTSKAQNCFVGSAIKNNQRLISVVFKSKGAEVYTDTRKLIDYGYEAFTQYKILSKGDFVKNIQVKGAAEKAGLNLVAESDVFKFMKTGEKSIPVETKIELIQPTPTTITTGQVMGKVIFLLQGVEVGSTNLLAEHSISEKTMLSGLTSMLTDEMKKTNTLNWWLSIGIKLAIALVIWRILATIFRPRRKRKKKITPEEQAEAALYATRNSNVRKFERKR
jgi:D-alanyl-D-alanine carboxypeptidase (penicillin-binding protein 5/6)